MIKNRIRIFFSAVTLLIVGCAGPYRPIDPTLVQELRGVIKPDKLVYKTGESISVTYWISNVSEKIFQENIVDGSKEPGNAFQEYTFNAFSTEDKLKHLTLEKTQKPLSGIINLEPSKRAIFTKNVFLAKEPGTYILSFYLRWKNGKKVSFKPVTILIKSEEKKENIAKIEPALEKAISQLNSADYRVRAKAKETIIRFGAKSAPPLVKLLDSTNVKLRSEAMFTLIALGEKAVPTLINASKHESREIRMRSIYSLGQIGSQNALPVMTHALLKDSDKEVRATALRVVSENFIDQIAVPLMILALADEDLQIRKEAIKNLRTRTSLKFDFVAEAEKKERTKAIERWKNWWKESHPGAFR